MPVRSAKNADPADNFGRSNKEDTAVDSAIDSAENQNHPPTPFHKPEGGISDIWNSVRLKLKTDFGTAYVFNSRFKENAYEKYFRDCYLVAVEDGVAFVDSPQPHVLHQGLRLFQKRLRDTWRSVAGYEVEVQLVHTANTSSPRGESDSALVERLEPECA